MNKRPKVLIFAIVAAAGTVLNTLFLLVLLFRGGSSASPPASPQNDAAAQRAARAEVCLLLGRSIPTGDKDASPLSDLINKVTCTREDAEALLI
jgi:hypothetical protein